MKKKKKFDYNLFFIIKYARKKSVIQGRRMEK